VLKKFRFLLGLFLIALVSCNEEEVASNKYEAPETKDDIHKSFKDFGFSTDLSDDIAAYKTVVNIVRETGLTQNFIILPGDVDKVKAYIEDNERILEYNPNFIENIQRKKNWYGISVLARQIGHHLSKHELEGGIPSIEEEIKADQSAGFVLFKMGATLGDAISALESVIKEDGIHHKAIAKNTRITSLAKGWNNAKKLMTDTVIQTENLDVDSMFNFASKKKRLIPRFFYRVFLALEKKIYYIGAEGKVYEEINGQYVPVGIKKDSYKTGFDWMFVKDGDSYGVDLKGRLWAFSSDGNFHIVGQAVKLNIK
tara:strand:+ start:5076 stop:6011 length:936 start_codon:yes stop_codon:yes gene_type:complete